jgi:heavy metal efflux system protein
VSAVIDFALRQRALVVAFLVLVVGAGAVCFLKLNIEAYPDPVPPMVDVVTQSTGSGPHGPSDPAWRGKLAVIAKAAGEVSHPILFSAAIIIAGFVPLLTLSGIEGHIFGPMARTYAYAITGGILATFTVAPALSSLLLESNVSEAETAVVRFMHKCYDPLIGRVLANRRLVLLLAGAVLLISCVAASRLGLEFLPKLEEGNLWVRATMPVSISLEESEEYVNEMRREISLFPEVSRTVSQHGRPDDGTDATDFFNAEFFVPLLPQSQWPPGLSKDALSAQIAHTLQRRFPGVEFNFSQYIEDNVEEAASGVKGENSIKVFGPDLHALEKIARNVADTIKGVGGITDLAVLESLGQPTLQIEVDREPAGRYGLLPSDINATVQAAIGGQAAGDLYEPGGDRHFPLVVRLSPQYRGDVDSIRRLSIAAPDPSGSGTIPVALAESPISRWCRGLPSSIGKVRSAMCRSSSACAAVTSGPPCSKRSNGSLATSSCRPGTASNGSGNSAISRRQPNDCRSPFQRPFC